MKRLSREDYTVGWICPLEVEQIAALHMLDERHSRLPQPPTDHNVYNLGAIDGHNVVIAGLPQAGNNSAATVVTQLRMTFPNVRFGLLVGIGGGVPVKTDSGIIRLGDVVVSKPTGIHSGAVQYDHGKAWLGRFERTGAHAPPPAVLLNAAQNLAVKRAMNLADPIEENMKRINTTIRTLRHFAYPGRAQDHLYLPSYVHLQRGVPCDECNCDVSQRIPRLVDEDDNMPYITVHRGTIASGEMVLKDAILRDRLAEDGLLCFETEAAGALTGFACLVIRGVSDYCDSHKNDIWHGYAAAAAASYARQLFFHMPIDEVRRDVCVMSSTDEEAFSVLRTRMEDVSSQMSSLTLALNTQHRQHSPSHSKGFILALDEDGLSKLVRAYVKQAVQESSIASTDELIRSIDEVSLKISAEAQNSSAFNSEDRVVRHATKEAVKDTYSTPTTRTSTKAQKSRFVKLFRTKRRFVSKFVAIIVRVNQLRQRCTAVRDTASYFSIEVDILPRVLSSWGLSISFSNIANARGHYDICPSIRPIRIFSWKDPIVKAIYRDDLDTLSLMMMNGEFSAQDCLQDGSSIFKMSLRNDTLQLCRYLLENSRIPAATLFESAGFYFIEDFLDVDTFGRGYAGVDLALTQTAVEIIRKSECEPAGGRGDLFVWYELFHHLRQSDPTSDEPVSHAKRILNLGIEFTLFSWCMFEYDYKDEDLDYHPWMLRLCFALGGDPNLELSFLDDNVPLEYALGRAEVLMDCLEEMECENIVSSVGHALLVPLIEAGADIHYIRERDGELQSITDLAFSLNVEDCWELALRECGFDWDEVIEEDERRLKSYRRNEPFKASGVDIKSIYPSHDGLRRRI